MRSSVTVLTYTPSPYQVELFDEVAKDDDVDLRVLYLHRRDREREWTEKERKHVALYMEHGAPDLGEAREWVRNSDLFVLNYYQDARAMSMLDTRLTGGRPWTFWGERMGFRHPVLGRLVRRWYLRALHGSRTPIWGIGQWAVDAYRKEFGPRREYLDLPYFSNLSRFRRTTPDPTFRPCIFLYSGALTERKGVDLLAAAFVRLVKTNPQVHLQILGSGPEETRLKEHLAACAAQVTFLGFRDWPSLPEVYHGAHVLCAPSRHDGWAMVVPEGLAAGLPVISTNQTGAALEFLREGENGWMIPANDEGALHSAMLKAAELSDDAWRRMSRAAAASVANHDLTTGARQFGEAAQRAMHPASD